MNLTVVDHQQTGQRFFIGTLVPAANDVSSSGSNEANYKQDFSIFDKMLQPTIAITKEGLIDYVNDPMMQLTGTLIEAKNNSKIDEIFRLLTIRLHEARASGQERDDADD